MVAIDQRVSLETMFLDAGRAPDTDAMDAFRADVLRILGPHASAVLLERGLVERGGLPELGGPPPGRILAAERLEQVRGHGATGSTIDPDGPEIAARIGAQALKLMAVWWVDADPAPVESLVRAFVAGTHAAGLPAVVEGIVRGREGVTPDAFLAASAAMARDADLYKAQVPTAGGEDEASITALSHELTASISCPWVVLSTGVPAPRFPAALAAACRGGASGFLAGRAIWGPALAADDPGDALEGLALATLRQLRAIVDAEARPWHATRVPAAAG
jgi:sulfofructosephosphate aldolase